MNPRQREGRNPARSGYTHRGYKRGRIPAADPVRSNAISRKSSHHAPACAGVSCLFDHTAPAPAATGAGNVGLLRRRPRVKDCAINLKARVTALTIDE